MHNIQHEREKTPLIYWLIKYGCVLVLSPIMSWIIVVGKGQPLASRLSYCLLAFVFGAAFVSLLDAHLSLWQQVLALVALGDVHTLLLAVTRPGFLGWAAITAAWRVVP